MTSSRDLRDRFIARRQFLVGAGASLALPPLLSLMPNDVAAQTLAGRKRRTIIYFSIQGIHAPLLYPTTDPAGLQVLANATHVRHRPLSQIPGRLSYMIDESFKDLYPYMNVMRGLSLTGGNYQGHNVSVLSGFHSGLRDPKKGRTIDVLLERSPSVYKSGEYVPHKAVRITSYPGLLSHTHDCVNGVRVSSKALYGDASVFSTLFGGPLPTVGASGPTQDQKNDVRLVDRVYADLKNLERSDRLSSEDRLLLDNYITSVHELQQRVQAAAAVTDGGVRTCQKPTTLKLEATGAGGTYSFPGDAKWQIQSPGAMFENYNDMIKLAFACDLTRVVWIGNIMWRDSLHFTNNDNDLHHKAPSATAAMDKQQWGLKKMASLARKLRDFNDPFGGGNLLDNSVILYANELGDWTTGHSTLSMPAVTFGKCGGRINTGNYVDFIPRPYREGLNPGRPYKQLLQTVLAAMGVSEAEYSSFGDGQGFGEFKEYILQFGKNLPTAFSAYKSEHNKPLPLIYNPV